MMNKKFEDIFEYCYNGSPDNLELALLKMKEGGATQMQSAVVLIEKLKLSIKDADYLIVHSNAWKENKDNLINGRNEFGDFLDGINKDS